MNVFSIDNQYAKPDFMCKNGSFVRLAGIGLPNLAHPTGATGRVAPVG